MEWWHWLILLTGAGIVADMLLSRICKTVIVKAAMKEIPELREKILSEIVSEKILSEIVKNHKI